MFLNHIKGSLLFVFVLMQLVFTAQSDTMSCKMLYRRIYQMKYDVVMQEIEKGASCDCFHHTTHTGKGPAPKFWRPGWLFEAIIHGLTPERTTSESHSLISETLYMPVTPGRDSLLTFLVNRSENYNHLMNDWPLKRYMSHSMKKYNEELFDLMYRKADDRHKDAAVETAIRYKCNPFLSRYIGDKQWGDDGVMFLLDLVCADTVELVDEIWKRKLLSPNAKTKIRENTLLNLVIHDKSHGKCQLTIEQKEALINSLVENRYNFNWENYKGYTPLEESIKEGDYEFMEMLVAHSNLKRLNDDRQTYLHLAVKYNKEEIVAEILAAGVDKNRKDKKGKTALDYAKEYQVEILKMLGAPVDKKLDNSQFLQRMNLKDTLTEEEKNKVFEIVESGEYYYSFINHKGYQIPALAEQSIRARNLFMTYQVMRGRKIVLSEKAQKDILDWYDECLKKVDDETLRVLNQLNNSCVERNISALYEKMDQYYYGFSDRKKHHPRMLELIKNLNYTGRLPVQLGEKDYTFYFTGIHYDTIVPYYHVPLYKVKQEGKWGVIDPWLEEIIPCRYDQLRMDTSTDYNTGAYSLFIGQHGEDASIMHVRFKDGYQLQDHYQLPNRSIEKVVLKNYKLLLWTERRGKKGMSVLHNSKIVHIYPPEYDQVRLLPQSVLAVQKDELWSLQYSKEYDQLKFKWREYKVDGKTIYVRKKKNWKEYRK